jgi:hypothetical protein
MNFKYIFKEEEIYIKSFFLVSSGHLVDAGGLDVIQGRMWNLQEGASNKLSQTMPEMRTALLQGLYDP